MTGRDRPAVPATTLLPAHDDHVGHEVSDDEFVSGSRSGGSYRALCGEQILAAPLEVAPARRCSRCAAAVAAHLAPVDDDHSRPRRRSVAELLRGCALVVRCSTRRGPAIWA